MEFIDHNGHIFSLPSYKTYPVGYEYDEQPYIFWLNDTKKLSTDNYYIKPIRFIINEDDYDLTNTTLSIKIESSYYKLMGSYHLNNLLNKSKNLFDYLTISSDMLYWEEGNYDSITNENKPGYIKFDLLKDTLTEDDITSVQHLTGEYVEDYEVQRYCGWSFVGCEDFNISRQMEIRNAYLTKLRNSSGRLTVRLANPNFALQRGTLVTIVRMRYDYEYKVRMLNSESNLYPGAQERGFKPDPSSGEVNGIRDEDILHNDGVGVIGAEDSGIYYIDGMRFDYINGNEKIQQYLYLIKRDPLTSLSNLSTWDKIKDPQS